MSKAAALLFLLLVPLAGAQQNERPNALLLIAKPELVDPSFRETVVRRYLAEFPPADRAEAAA